MVLGVITYEQVSEVLTECGNIYESDLWGDCGIMQNYQTTISKQHQALPNKGNAQLHPLCMSETSEDQNIEREDSNQVEVIDDSDSWLQISNQSRQLLRAKQAPSAAAEPVI